MTFALLAGFATTHGEHFSVAHRPDPDAIYFAPGPEHKLAKEAEAMGLADEGQSNADANTAAEVRAQENKRYFMRCS